LEERERLSCHAWRRGRGRRHRCGPPVRCCYVWWPVCLLLPASSLCFHHAEEGGVSVADAGLLVRHRYAPEGAAPCASSSPPAAFAPGRSKRETRERDQRERREREGWTCVELFPLCSRRPRRSELSRGRNGKPLASSLVFLKPLHAWRATSVHQPHFRIADVE
jgi:hypothetical protein